MTVVVGAADYPPCIMAARVMGEQGLRAAVGMPRRNPYPSSPWVCVKFFAGD
jgi:hypothetical protein